jgi:hypothetical protein
MKGKHCIQYPRQSYGETRRDVVTTSLKFYNNLLAGVDGGTIMKLVLKKYDKIVSVNYSPSEY